jgi:two-component system, response regulator
MLLNFATEILLVEDNPNDVKLTLKAFQKNNLANTVHIVEDGEEALNFLFARGKYEGQDRLDRIRVILLDLKLPKVDGLEVLKTIKSDPRTKLIPVVVLTSSREERDVLDSYQFRANSYIVKPVEFNEFIRTVSELGLYWLLLNEPPLR